jgi:prevent-host-death family protein
MTLVNIYEAKTQLSRLIERVQAGEDIVIGRNGTPVARLTRYTETKPRRVLGGWADRIRIADDFDETPGWLIDAFEGHDS